MTRCKKCYSLEEKIVSGISAAAAKRGITESEVLQNILTLGLAKDHELTMAERFHFQRESINKSLDNLLLLFGVSVQGGLSDKFQTLTTLCMQMSRQKTRKSRYAVMEQSLFEVLNDLKDMDIDLFTEWTTYMSKHGRLRQRYFYLYPKSSKKGMTVKNKEYDTIHNKYSNVTNTNPLTELNEPKDFNIPDDQYPIKKRKSKSPHLDTQV